MASLNLLMFTRCDLSDTIRILAMRNTCSRHHSSSLSSSQRVRIIKRVHSGPKWSHG